MTGTRTARTQALALRIGELLDRGCSAESIRAELIRRSMPADTAAELVRRVVAAKERARARPVSTHNPGLTPATPHGRDPWRGVMRAGRQLFAPRRASAPAILGCAALTFLMGFQLLRGADDGGAAELVARLTADVHATQTEVFRLEAELVSRKQDAQELQALRARIGAGPVRFASQDAYRAAVERYQRRLKSWNANLDHYQQVGREYTALVALLNARSDSLALVSRGRTTPAAHGRD